MPDRQPVRTTNLSIYDNAPLSWDRTEALLVEHLPDAGTPGFLGTCGPDGVPDAAGIGALWLAGELYFTSAPGTRKSRNLAKNPACTVSFRLPSVDLVLKGTAARVTDVPTLEAVAARYREGGWPTEVAESAFVAPFSAPSAGPPPWHLYRVAIRSATGVATVEPGGATRWTF